VNIKRLTTYYWLALVLVFCTGVAQAQFSSSIEGTVTDSSGAVIPNAKVVVTGMTTGVAIPTKTNGTGFYKFPALGHSGERSADCRADTRRAVHTATEIDHSQCDRERVAGGG
jgi:hypothetical protein